MNGKSDHLGGGKVQIGDWVELFFLNGKTVGIGYVADIDSVYYHVEVTLPNDRAKEIIGVPHANFQPLGVGLWRADIPDELRAILFSNK